MDKVSYKAESEAWLGFSQVGFTRGESRDMLLCSPSFSCSPPDGRPSPQPKNLRAALNPLSVLRLPASQAQRCFFAEISGRGAVCVLGQTCPSFDTRADADSDWAANQDHSLSSPLLPPQSSPTQDMCHCQWSALEDTTSWRSGQIPAADKRDRKKSQTQPPNSFFLFFYTDGLLKKFIFLKWVAYFMVL